MVVSPSVLALGSEQGRGITPRGRDTTQRHTPGTSRDAWTSKWPNPPPPITLYEPPPSSDLLRCRCAPWGHIARRGANHCKWPSRQLLQQRTLPHTTLRCTPPTTPGGTNPSPPFTLHHPPHHPSPTNPSLPFTLCHQPRHPSPTNLSLPFTLHHPPRHPSPTTSHRLTPSAQRRNHPSPPNTLRHPPPGTPTRPAWEQTQCTQYTHHGHKGVDRGYMMRSPQGGMSAGMNRQKVVMCRRRGINPASG